jgi:4-diphosphocytidyl-2-C-methyl-D-erythritol kinase
VILRAHAPAKINRELRVGRRRADGYHEILSRVTSIDLADSIEVEPAGDLLLSVAGADVPADDTNLAARAARLLAARLSIPPRARIRLQKNVPIGAGLGGGSADGAVTLLLLARLWEASLSSEELMGLAARLGSDAPFFLVGGEADIAGRGEHVTPREDSPSEDLLLLVPPFSLSTSEVYASYDHAFGPAGRPLPPRLEVETSGRFFGPNDLASAVLGTHSEMTAYLRAVGETVADHAMTGSGSVIALREASREAAEALRLRFPECRLVPCRTLGREEYRRRIQATGGLSWT